MEEIEGSEQLLPCQLCLLALGFLGPQSELLSALGVEKDGRGNVKTDGKSYGTSVEGVWAAGDARRGQSLVVWGIAEGRKCAAEVDIALMSSTRLPVTGGMKTR